MNYKEYLGSSFDENSDEFDVKKATDRAYKEKGNVNVLLIGATGVGKSTLINAIFGKNVVKAGSGEPVTSHLEKIYIKEKGLTLWDTKGIEAKEYKNTINEITGEIKKAFEKLDVSEAPHIALLCIKESSERIEGREYELLKFLKSQEIPTIVVFTDMKKSTKAFFDKAVELINNKGYSSFIQNRFCRVNSIAYEIDDDFKVEPKGLEELYELILNCLEEANKNVARRFKKIQVIKIQEKFQAMKEGAKAIVHVAAVSAGTAGAAPIPGSDAPIIAAIQSAMIYKLNTEFEVSASEASMTSIISGILGTTALAQVGKTIVTNLLKFIPGAGTVVGGAISAATAVAITEAVGFAYIAVLEYYFDDETGKVEFPENTTKILELFKSYFKPSK